MNVEVQSEVQSFKDHSFVDQGDHDLVVFLKSLKHVAAHLECRRVERFSISGLSTAKIDQDSSKLEGVVEYVVLD